MLFFTKSENRSLRVILNVDFDKMPYFLGQDDQKLAYVVNSRVVKTLSEVGFEPTPTFVDQNTPVRKSSTLESGALDRSAILTCHFEKRTEYLTSTQFQLRGNPKFDSSSSVDAPRFYLALNN